MSITGDNAHKAVKHLAHTVRVKDALIESSVGHYFNEISSLKYILLLCFIYFLLSLHLNFLLLSLYSKAQK